MADLSGKVAVVTEGSRGVGKGIAEGLAEAGATVYITGRSNSREDPPAAHTVQATACLIDELGGRGIPVALDHNDDAAVEALFARIESEQGRLDLLVNNVYQMPEPPAPEGGFWEHPISIWDDHCGVGLRGCYVASVFAAPLMVRQRRGLIVNISSRGEPEHAAGAPYRAVKAAVDRLAQDMALQLRDHGVAALVLRPGLMKTGTALDLKTAQSPRFSGRCVAALAMDPDVMEKSGGIYEAAELAREYRFTDPDSPPGRQP